MSCVGRRRAGHGRLALTVCSISNARLYNLNEIYDVWGADRHAACVKLYARFPNSPLGVADCMPVSVQKKKEGRLYVKSHGKSISPQCAPTCSWISTIRVGGCSHADSQEAALLFWSGHKAVYMPCVCVLVFAPAHRALATEAPKAA